MRGPPGGGWPLGVSTNTMALGLAPGVVWPESTPPRRTPPPPTHTRTPRTILLSVISLLNEPNTFSPANVDASVMYRKWKESKGKDREYTDIIR